MNDPNDDLQPETRALLGRGRHGHALSDGRRRGLKRAVLAQVAAGSVLATTTTAAAWTTSALNLGSAAVLALAVGGGIHAVVTRNDPAPKARVVHVNDVKQPSQRSEVTPPTRPNPAVADPLMSPDPSPTPGPGPGPGPSPAPSPAPDPSPGVAARATGVTPAGTAHVAVADTVPALPEPPVPAAIAPVPPPAASLEAEARLIAEADWELKAGNTAGALRLLDEHSREFPAGALEPERSAERVLALCGAGRAVEAERAARSFLAAHGKGPLASRVRGSCGGAGL